MYRMKLICLLLLTAFLCPQFAFCDDVIAFSKLDDGVIIYLKKSTANGARLLRLQVVTDNIIHVMASPVDSFFSNKSLMALDIKRTPAKWELKEKEDELVISTLRVNATIAKTTGAVTFTDKNGKLLVAEKSNEGKIFTPDVLDGQPCYRPKQVFESPQNEGLYGLGQHQQGIMNYKGQHIDLLQSNTEVAVPFLVSTRNYGILWDNYAITSVGDSRPFQPLSTLKLFSASGEQGWLTATYAHKANPADVIVQRPESVIGYEFINSLKELPEGFKPANGVVTWNGFIQSSFVGTHTFQLKYAGYTKIWIDGHLLADRWRQPWNPCTSTLSIYLDSSRKHSFKIEWIPDGSESYISCKWLSPLQGTEKEEYAFSSEAGNQVNYYLLYGTSMDEIIGGYREITGKATLLPKWAMGLWQSRERYKTQDEILNTVAEFRRRNIPLDNIVLDWSYWEEDKWGSQEFDASRFPDPAGMIQTLHDQYHTHFMISVWPKFYKGIANYNYFDQKGWLYKRNIANEQRDWIGKGYVSTFYDAYNDSARIAFWNLVNRNLFSKGIDAWWLDASEPDICSNINIDQRKQLMGPTAVGSSTQYFNDYAVQHAKGIYEGQRLANNNQRVFILTRSGYAGLQHYAAATWSGDIAARWQDLQTQIPAGINFCMSGLPWWTTDIGGFAVENRYEKAQGRDLEEWRELNTRWYQFGAFCPLFRVHGQYPYREIYNISPEGSAVYESMLYYDRLRYRLMPYIYSLAGDTWHNNYTIMRGLVMDFAEDTTVHTITNQFMFGPSILVTPVTAFHTTSQAVYLPAGTGWYNFYTGAYNKGGEHITADAPLQRLPLFIKEGSIVPIGPALQYTAEKPADTITLWVYTGKDAAFTIYEDEGTNYNYEKGLFTNITCHYNETAGTLTIEDRKGAYPGMLQQRVFRVVWAGRHKPVGFDVDRNADAIINYTGKKTVITNK